MKVMTAKKTKISPENCNSALLAGIVLTLFGSPSSSWAGIKTTIQKGSDGIEYDKPSVEIKVMTGREGLSSDTRYSFKATGLSARVQPKTLASLTGFSRSQTLITKAVSLQSGKSSIKIGCSGVANPDCGDSHLVEFIVTPQDGNSATDRAESILLADQVEACFNGFKLGVYNYVKVESTTVTCGTLNIEVP